MKRPEEINNLVVISDIHAGCKFGLCQTKSVKLDNGGTYSPSPQQRKMRRAWDEWWGDHVPMLTKDEPYDLIINGDSIDGAHHGVKTTITNNFAVQADISREIIYPITQKEKCIDLYMIRGTESHDGKSGEEVERLARELKAVKDEFGNYSRWELWYRMGGNSLINFAHTVGNTSTSAYESTAVLKELIEAFVEAGKWKDEPPDVVVRSHRHRPFMIALPAQKGMALSLITPGWQLKTPYTYNFASGRAGTPIVGGFVIRRGDEDDVYARWRVWKMSRTKEVKRCLI